MIKARISEYEVSGVPAYKVELFNERYVIVRGKRSWHLGRFEWADYSWQAIFTVGEVVDKMLSNPPRSTTVGELEELEHELHGLVADMEDQNIEGEWRYVFTNTEDKQC